MNYPPNTNHWKAGDIVIHDADAQRQEMLMVVCGYNRDGYCKTRYIFPHIARTYHKKYCENQIKYLHPPSSAIEINEPSVQLASVYQWNKYYRRRHLTVVYQNGSATNWGSILPESLAYTNDIGIATITVHQLSTPYQIELRNILIIEKGK